MADPVILVENLSKKFVLSHEKHERYSTLRDTITEKASSLFKKNKTESTKEDFYALSDLNFQINRGERIGIIGRNGAGKSTLLKILSRITEPSSGKIIIKGRVASLLEVGTGFHPELSGRENIFLNGAILGMSRQEIRKKFDEIVDFAEVEKFLDTPVKRYSSGMYVRLAFAVAAHLEPEILVVDEVLAVGDAQFQQKCLGKMQDVSNNEGRTILFVSHNLQTIKNLCSKIIYLKQGKLVSMGGVEETITEYLSENKKVGETGDIPVDFHRKYSNGQAYFRKIFITGPDNIPTKEIPYNCDFKVKILLEVVTEIKDVLMNVFIVTPTGDSIAFMADCRNGIYKVTSYLPGIHEIELDVNMKLLPIGYNISAGLSFAYDGLTIDWVENVFPFSISKVGLKKGEDYPWDVVHGFVEPQTNWKYLNDKYE